MDFYDVLRARRTIRDFEATQIEDATIKRIVACGLMAPTNDHMRDWHFVLVKDRRVVENLLDIIPQYNESDVNAAIRDWNLNDSCQQAAYRNAIPKQHKMLADSACIIVPLFKQKTDILHPENLSHLNGFASIWCCIENILLAATAEGFACTLRIPLGDEGEHTRKVLSFPKEYLMPCFIGVGKPAENARPNRQNPCPLEERLHVNGW